MRRTDMMDLSQAKEIKGYKDYWVFSDGRIYSDKTCRGERGRFLQLNLCGPTRAYCCFSVYQNGRREEKRVHREVAKAFIGPPPLGEDGEPLDVDHIDGDAMNNNVYNLRYATKPQNAVNRGLAKNNTSGYKGVSFYKQSKKWESYIGYKGKKIRLGLFDCKIEAAKAYDKKAYELYGEFAWLNFPDDYR